MEPYADSFEHLRDEFSRLDLLLRRALVVARQDGSAPAADDFRGLLISEPEIDNLLKSSDFLGDRWRQAAKAQETLKPIDQALLVLRNDIDSRRALSEEANIHLVLPHLAKCFDLSPAEVDLLLVALAPELEPRYETLYAYLQNDVTRKRPSVDLALNLICRSEQEKVFARRLFALGAPLFRHCLLQLAEESHDRRPPLIRKFLKLDDELVDFLLLARPSEATDTGALLTPARGFNSLEMEPSTLAHFENLATYLKQAGAGGGAVIRLIGQAEAGLREAAEALAYSIGRRLLVFELQPLEGTDTESSVRLAAMIRDARIWGAIIAVSAGEPAENEPDSNRRSRMEGLLWRKLQDFPGFVLLLGPDAAFRRLPNDLRVLRLEVAPPGFAVRRGAWEAALNGDAPGIDIARLADTFRFGARQIHQTVGMAAGLAALRDPLNPAPSIEDVFEAGRALSTPNLRHFAVRVEPRYTWSDIVLPQEKAEQLRNIAARMKFRHLVQQEWGFGRKLSRGKGLNVLFTGPSGTGKTMAAEILAGELSLDLYQIELSSVVSKYIGETEKHLSEIFHEAELSQALLFFDEADALFGKRTEVKDAHDRYANIEVNYLLQRVEQFEGIVVLATNLQRNVDEAFLRRMHEVVEFPFPDETLREGIWRGHFPRETPCEDEIDFAFLARQFKLTGGNIKNIVLNAAYLAAQESNPISMSHLILATKAEHQKLGKMCVKSDFGPYYELVEQRA